MTNSVHDEVNFNYISTWTTFDLQFSWYDYI